MILLVVAGLSVSGVVTYSALRSSLLERVDQQLERLQSPAGHLLKDQLGLGGPGAGCSVRRGPRRLASAWHWDWSRGGSFDARCAPCRRSASRPALSQKATSPGGSPSRTPGPR